MDGLRGAGRGGRLLLLARRGADGAVERAGCGAALVVAGTGGVHVLLGGLPDLTGAEVRIDLPADEAVLGVAPISLPQGIGRIAILTTATLVIADQHQVLATRPAELARTQAGGPPAVASGDVDGDGLGDVVLVDDEGVRVILAVAEPPLGGRADVTR